jgi:hypothetical protein
MSKFGVDTDCSICGERTRRRGYRRCQRGHRYHQGCINNWFDSQEDRNLDTSCPTCRTNMRRPRTRTTTRRRSEYDPNRVFIPIDNNLEERLEIINGISHNPNDQLINFYFNDGNTMTVTVNTNDQTVFSAFTPNGQIDLDYENFLEILYGENWNRVLAS